MKLGRLARPCPFDGSQCEREPDPFDGDFQCGALVDESEEGNETVLVPMCHRVNTEALKR